MTRFIFITGGVVSSLGKGLASAALGALLQARGYKVRLRKLDPYLNVDPGTMSPYQHGEVYVTDDGAETDLDLGHYERFTGVASRQSDNITTGRIWYSEYSDMLAADDGNPKTMAKMYAVKLLWNDPQDAPDGGKQVYDTMFPIVQKTFVQRGSKSENMNGRGRVSGSHRADVRLAVDQAGEMYVYSKSDGMIRRIVAATPTQ